MPEVGVVREGELLLTQCENIKISGVKWLQLVHPEPYIFQLNTLNDPTHKCPSLSDIDKHEYS